jgi:hypothetical protein
MRNIAIIFAVIAIAFVSCTKDIPEAKMTIEGYVFDKKTNQPLANAIIELNMDRKKIATDSTNADGFFRMKDVTMGDYKVIISMPGYATEAKDATAGNILVTDVKYNRVVTIKSELVALDHSVNLTIYKQYGSSLDGTLAVAAANAPYTISLGAYNELLEGTTDANGLISRSDLPDPDLYDNNIVIMFDFTEGVIRYKQEIIYAGNDITGNSKLASTITGYLAEGNFAMASSNTLDALGRGVKNFTVDGNIVVNFTQPVDTTIAHRPAMQLSYDYSKTTMADDSVFIRTVDIFQTSSRPTLNTSWSNNNTILTINPVSDLTRGLILTLNVGSLRNADQTQASPAFNIEFQVTK